MYYMHFVALFVVLFTINSALFRSLARDYSSWATAAA